MFSRLSVVLRPKPGYGKAFGRANGRPQAPVCSRTASKCRSLSNSTSSSTKSDTTKGCSGACAFTLVSLFTAGTTYFLLRDKRDPTVLIPKYGSAKDFQDGIQTLHYLFPEERVSTEDADLHDHGFSLNDYHPGMTLKLSCIPIHNFLASIQGHYIVSLCTPCLQRMSSRLST